MFVADAASMSVKRFTESGEFLGEFGARGDGEGQFLTLFAIAFDGDAVVVADAHGRTFSWWSAEGRFLRELELKERRDWPRQFALWREGWLMLYLASGDRKRAAEGGAKLLRVRSVDGMDRQVMVLPSGDVVPRQGPAGAIHFGAYPGHFTVLPGGEVAYAGSVYDGRVFRYTVDDEGAIARQVMRGHDPGVEPMLVRPRDGHVEPGREFTFTTAGASGRIVIQSGSLGLLARRDGRIVQLGRADHDGCLAVWAQEFDAHGELAGFSRVEPLSQELQEEGLRHEVIGLGDPDRIAVLHYVDEIFPVVRIFRLP